MNIIIEEYDDWMKPQIAELFCKQYNVSKESFEKLIETFYEHPYQKEKCIRLIAREGNTIIGFQSFFYWPYTYKDKTYNSYQSGNSLVHENYRGKGIFQKLLTAVEEKRKRLNIDFFIGFPIDQSINSLLRNGWHNILNLKWYINLINPLAFMFVLKEDRLLNEFSMYPEQSIFELDKDYFRITQTANFEAWRLNYSDKKRYYYYTYNEGNKKIFFSFKLNIRKKIIRELIIGNIICNNVNKELIINALQKILALVKKMKCITLVSIANNDDISEPNSLREVLNKLQFKKINKEIYFTIKPFINDPEVLDPQKWKLFRSDIDTWQL